MKLHLPPGLDAAGAAAATEAVLGLRPAVEARPAAEQKDALAVATFVLTLPPAILATWGLAERLGLLARLARWLDAVRALPRSDDVVLTLPGGARRPLAGLAPGELIDAAVAASPDKGPEAQDWDVFVVHAGPDRAEARRLWEALTVAGVVAFLDRASLRPGHDWPARLATAMGRTRLFLVLVSPHWKEAWYAQDEVARAVALCRAAPGRTILPAALDAEIGQPHCLPYGLAHLQPVHLASLSPAERAATVVAAVRAALADTAT